MAGLIFLWNQPGGASPTPPPYPRDFQPATQQFAAGSGLWSGGTDHRKRQVIADEVRAILAELRAADEPAPLAAAEELAAEFALPPTAEPIDWAPLVADMAEAERILAELRRLQSALRATAAFRADEDEAIALLLLN